MSLHGKAECVDNKTPEDLNKIDVVLGGRDGQHGGGDVGGSGGGDGGGSGGEDLLGFLAAGDRFLWWQEYLIIVRSQNSHDIGIGMYTSQCHCHG